MTAFTLKAGLTPVTTLHLQTCDLDDIHQALQEKAAQAPNMFRQLPCVLDFSGLDSDIDLRALNQRCRDAGLLPIGVRAAQAHHKELLGDLSLTDFGKATSSAKQPESKKTEAAPSPIPPTLHKFPVRSGQQVIAEGDLIIFGLVSAGAEVLAGGSIHVYGPLRGRALAGIRGDRSAAISCQNMEAELVSVSGEYKLFDNEKPTGGPALIHLDEHSLIITDI